MLSQVSHVYDVLTTAPARACTKFLWENNILSVTGRSNAGKIGTISLKLTVLENKVIFAYKICLQLNIHSKNLFGGCVMVNSRVTNLEPTMFLVSTNA